MVPRLIFFRVSLLLAACLCAAAQDAHPASAEETLHLDCTCGEELADPQPAARADESLPEPARVPDQKPRPEIGPVSPANPWVQLTLADLDACYAGLSAHHPGPVDAQNPGFVTWLEQGYAQAKKLAHGVTDADGMLATLQYYASGFEDGHLTYRNYFERREIQWPGFVIALRDGRYVVHHVAADAKGDLPAPGDTLIACDGIAPEDLMRDQVMPYYYGRKALESSWVRKAPLLLIRDGNPFRPKLSRCTFRGTEGEKTYDLVWRNTTREALRDPLDKAAFGPRGSYGVRDIDDKRAWVSLPSNGPKTPEELAALQELVWLMPEYSTVDLVVLDLRGNSGGNSRWGDLILEGLYGEAYMAYRRGLQPDVGSYAEWRVSAGNRAHLRDICTVVAERFGRDSESYRHFAAVGEAMDQALTEGKALVHLPTQAAESKPPAAVAPLFKGRLVVLTDGACGSACLDFVDSAKLIPDVVFVGFPTSADSQYMEVRRLELPSHMGRLGFAVKVYRNRARAPGEPHLPDHRYTRDLWDTPPLEAWLLRLVDDLDHSMPTPGTADTGNTP